MATTSALRASNAPPASSADGKAVSRRLQQELMQIMMGSNKDVTAFPDGDNLFDWIGTIRGTVGTVFEGMTFKLKLKFGAEYPFKAPTITFSTPIFHPNVDLHGNICLDILKEKWSAAYSVSTILLSLQSLLGEPNNASPLNGQAAQLWDNQVEYRRAVVGKYKEATGSGPSSGWGANGEA